MSISSASPSVIRYHCTVKFNWFFAILILITVDALGQGAIRERLYDDDTRVKFFAVPLLYRTPETNWVFGAGGLTYFKVHDDTVTRISNIRTSIAYTLNKQWLFWMPFDVFLFENKYRLTGQLAFYRYPYFFTGIGNNQPEDYIENYTAEFPRFRLTALKRFGDNLYSGPRYWYQNTRVLAVESGMQLDTAGIAGAQGGVTSGIGWVATYDNRDKVLSPRKGRMIQFETLFNSGDLGSDFDYNVFGVDIREYIPLKGDHTLAVNAYTQLIYGQAPFNRLAMLGGRNYLKGYPLGVFRDKKLLNLQGEFRSKYWVIFGFTAFAGAGVVADKVSEFATRNIRPAGGLGLRVLLDERERLVFRFDVAVGQNGVQYYLNVGEGF